MELLDLVVNRTHYVIEGSPLSKLKTSPEINTMFYYTTHPLPHTTSPYTIHGGTEGYLSISLSLLHTSTKGA